MTFVDALWQWWVAPILERATAGIGATSAAVLWHWWLAPVLVVAGVGMIIAIIVGYLKQVSSTRYPPKPRIPSEELNAPRQNSKELEKESESSPENSN